jgi:hypothetical protein
LTDPRDIFSQECDETECERQMAESIETLEFEPEAVEELES